ncbi:hypothetical protein KHP07_19380 [Pseudomonas sp. VS40]|uniref:hypothetical protein n=1 Tax=unclassified Pseudomonas TaxID=196821 RepID=UPI001BDE51E4|nr:MULTISPECIES: hypothetical protein [unclassified Pseudomonas]MBT1262536.1 hypothetical protein [Pseudomonas sp. VS40]MBT1274527.1 hypothetical protein [Pseudomonas sp. VS59]
MKRCFFERIAQYTIWTIWILLVAGSTLWLLVGSVAYWVRNGWLPADSAGWAQAIGAFVAIIVAIALPYFQSRQQRNDRAEETLGERLNGMSATYALMVHMEGLYARLEVYAQPTSSLFGTQLSGSKSDSLLHELNQAAAMLREIPVTAISSQMVYFIIGLREVANYGEFVSATLYDVSREPAINFRRWKKISANRQLIERWMEELDTLETEVRSRAR